MRLDTSWTKWYGQTMSETQFGYVVSDYNPRADALKTELAETAPQCLTDALPVYTGEYVGAPWGFAANIRDSCPEFAAWYSANWPGWYYRYLASHPEYALKMAISGFPLAMRPWDATKAISPIPGPIRDAMFPITAMDGTSVYDPALGYWCLIFSAAVLALVRWRSRTVRYLKANAVGVAVTTTVVVGSLLSIFVNLLLVPSYPLETNRVNISTSLAIRLVGILGAVFVTWHIGPMLIRRTKSPADHD